MCTGALSNMAQKSLPTLPVDPAAVSGQQPGNNPLQPGGGGRDGASSRCIICKAGPIRAYQMVCLRVACGVCLRRVILIDSFTGANCVSLRNTSQEKHAQNNHFFHSLRFFTFRISTFLPAQFEQTRATKVNNRIDNCVYFNM